MKNIKQGLVIPAGPKERASGYTQYEVVTYWR
jgi:hypothetical protein